MIRHLLALTWNRRRTNLLLTVEIFVAFLVVVTVSIVAAYFVPLYRQPLGYSVADIWRVRLHAEHPGEAAPAAQLLAAVAALPPVAAVAGADSAPYEGARHAIINKQRADQVWATDTLPATLGLQVVRGRWFDRSDDGAAQRPVVLTERSARAHFGDADPLGQRLEEEGAAPMRVVGVVRSYRAGGEFGGAGHTPAELLFQRWSLGSGIPPRLLVRLRPGTRAEFEETLTRAIHDVARGWSVEITPLEDLRRRQLRLIVIALGPVPVVAGFLLAMVGLGLAGVVWQNVLQRTAEIGVRRAHGATAADIRRQLLGELAAMASVAMAAGGVVVANFAAVVAPLPVFGLSAYVRPGAYATGFVVAVIALYALVIAAGFFPARLATKVQPFQALRYE